MANRVQVGNLEIAKQLYSVVENGIAPGTGLDPDAFWNAFEQLVDDLWPKNRALLEKRDGLQAKIDAYHLQRRGQTHDPTEYKQFLYDIGYIVQEGEPFSITTQNADPEITTIAGPQLVVPVMNARYALNAVNARWGSLYDALYGTDVIPEDDGAEMGSGYNPRRGAKVMAYGSSFLDETAPLIQGSHADVSCYRIKDTAGSATFVAVLASGETTGLLHKEQLAGYVADGDDLQVILLKKRGGHDHHLRL
ncbi:MAG: hypothetical protein P8X96_16905 [Desulfobacteraceae bacterium]